MNKNVFVTLTQIFTLQSQFKDMCLKTECISKMCAGLLEKQNRQLYDASRITYRQFLLWGKMLLIQKLRSISHLEFYQLVDIVSIK